MLNLLAKRHNLAKKNIAPSEYDNFGKSVHLTENCLLKKLMKTSQLLNWLQNDKIFPTIYMSNESI